MRRYKWVEEKLVKIGINGKNWSVCTRVYEKLMLWKEYVQIQGNKKGVFLSEFSFGLSTQALAGWEWVHEIMYSQEDGPKKMYSQEGDAKKMYSQQKTDQKMYS